MDFAKLNKLTADSYNQQKRLIKNVLAGKQVTCQHCHQELKTTLLEQEILVRCEQGCTDLKLEK